jgi:adenosine deaminase
VVFFPFLVSNSVLCSLSLSLTLMNRLHMQMFSFLGAKFPNVRKSLHAGELALGMVVPEDLTHHITDAVRIAGAERIGHGVAIVHETDSLELLKEMKDKKVTVEINLTSNDFILGISGDAHPVTIYLQSEVPVVISTDDSGVSRNDLASQYTMLGSSYDISYAGIKKLVFNSILYSSLPEADREKMMSLVDTQFCIFESKIAALRV